MTIKKNPVQDLHEVFISDSNKYSIYQRLSRCFGYSQDMRQCAREVTGKLEVIAQFDSVSMSVWEPTITVHELRLLWELAAPAQRWAVENLAEMVKRRDGAA